MVHLTDIEKALANHDMAVIEHAFGALICFPDEGRIEGAKTVDALCKILARILGALQHDESVMPARVGGSIAAASQAPIGTAASYAAGARIVADHQYHWRGRYLQHAANNGRL